MKSHRNHARGRPCETLYFSNKQGGNDRIVIAKAKPEAIRYPAQSRIASPFGFAMTEARNRFAMTSTGRFTGDDLVIPALAWRCLQQQYGASPSNNVVQSQYSIIRNETCK